MGVIVSIDLGAGYGAKICYADDPDKMYKETSYAVYQNESADSVAEGIVGKLEDLLIKDGLSMDHVDAIGFVTPGILAEDGSYKIVANLDFPEGTNMKQLLEDKTGRPVDIDNDGNAGGLGEWFFSGQHAMLYWAFGGGWGGAEVSEEGIIKHSSRLWDGKSPFHYTNEPGFQPKIFFPEADEVLTRYDIKLQDFNSATRALMYDEVRAGFVNGGKPFKEEDVLIKTTESIAGLFNGRDAYRAEAFSSARGLTRLIRAAGKDIPELEAINQTNLRNLDEMYRTECSFNGIGPARRIYGAFGDITGIAAGKIYTAAVQDGAAPDTPIYIGGGLSGGFDCFADGIYSGITQNKDFKPMLYRSKLALNGENANLRGGLVLADKLRHKVYRRKAEVMI